MDVHRRRPRAHSRLAHRAGERGQNFIRRRAGEFSDLIQRRVGAEEFDHRAGLRFGAAGHVYDDEVHRHASQNWALRAPQNAIAATRERPQVAVGVAQRDGGGAHLLRRCERGAIAECFARLAIAHLQDWRFDRCGGGEFRVVGVERAGAVEADARTDEIEMIVGADQRAGGRGQRQRRARKEHRRIDEAPQLRGVEGVLGIGAAGEVAHHQRQRCILERAHRVRQFFGADAEPVHAGVNVKPGCAARVPGFDLRQRVQHRRQLIGGQHIDVVGGAVEHEDLRALAQCAAHIDCFLRRRREEHARARLRQGARCADGA